MHYATLDITAPGLLDESPLSDNEIFGAIVQLWMQSPAHRETPLHHLTTLLAPALKSKQYLLATRRERPMFYLSWLSLDEEAEYRYLRNPPSCLLDTDWTSGERMWIHDWIAPHGHTELIARLLQRRLFADHCIRALHHRDDGHGLRVKTFQGVNVMPAEAKAWFNAHPLPIDLRLPEDGFRPALKL